MAALAVARLVGAKVAVGLALPSERRDGWGASAMLLVVRLMGADEGVVGPAAAAVTLASKAALPPAASKFRLAIEISARPASRANAGGIMTGVGDPDVTLFKESCSREVGTGDGDCPST